MKNVKFWVRQVEHVFAFPDTSFACGLPRVAVGAKDLTLCDLNKNCRPGETGRRRVSDVVALLAEMVELEHDGISLAAFDAGMPGEVSPGA
jgi:hypothetical protein